jgi:hypothetical protein
MSFEKRFDMDAFHVRIFLGGKEIGSRNLSTAPRLRDFLVLKDVIDKATAYFLVDRVLLIEDDHHQISHAIEVIETDISGQICVRR